MMAIKFGCVSCREMLGDHSRRVKLRGVSCW
jgi:hypothetical protein